MNYCTCKDQLPEEIKRDVYVCQSCGMEIAPGDLAQDAPEPDYDETTQEEDDFYSEAGNEWAINNSI